MTSIPKIGDTFDNIDVPQQGGKSIKRNIKVVSVYPEQQKVLVRTDAGGNAIITFDALNNINENKNQNKMQFTKSELKSLINEEVQRKKKIEDLETKKVKFSDELTEIFMEDKSENVNLLEVSTALASRASDASYEMMKQTGSDQYRKELKDKMGAFHHYQDPELKNQLNGLGFDIVDTDTGGEHRSIVIKTINPVGNKKARVYVGHKDFDSIDLIDIKLIPNVQKAVSIVQKELNKNISESIKALEAKKTKLLKELQCVMDECGMEEAGDGIGLGIKHLAGEEERLAEETPSFDSVKNYCGTEFVTKFREFILAAKKCGMSQEEFKKNANNMIDTAYGSNWRDGNL